MTANTLRLDSFLPYRLSYASNLVSDVIARSYEALFGLKIPEWRLIAVIADGNGITQQEIGQRTRMDKVTVSRAAIALGERGLISRTPNPGDGRSHLLTLSTAGRELYDQVVPKALELEADIFGTLDAEELATFSALLSRITQSAIPDAQEAAAHPQPSA
jgi:DNA-binding MarR family transcriptional regulator